VAKRSPISAIAELLYKQLAMFPLLADGTVTELARADIIQRERPAAETAVVGAEDQPGDVMTPGPNILVLNDIWRYVPAYFQTLDAVQPRSEAGRRLLERRRRQKERQHQQQQQNGTVVESEAGENQRGTLPVDELLAYITNSATIDSSAASSTSGAATSRRGRRKNKNSTPSFDAIEDSSASSNTAPDDTSESRGKTVPVESRKKELQPSNVAAGNVADSDVADFVVVRRDGKHRPERPVQPQTDDLIAGRTDRKATFYDSLDEFSLHGDKATTKSRAEQADVDDSAASAVVDERCVSISLSAPSSQTQTRSTGATIPTDVQSHCTSLQGNPSSSERVRPVTLRYNDVVKGNKPAGRQEQSVVAVSAESSMNGKHTELCCRPVDDVKYVETTNCPTTTNGNDVEVLTTCVEPVDVPTTTTDGDSSARDTQQTAVGRVVEKVSCSTQTCSLEMPRSSDYDAVDDITDNESPPRRPSPVVFIDAKSAKIDDDELMRAGLGLSFGSFDDVASTGIEARDGDRSEGVGRAFSDTATSPVQPSGSTSSPATPEMTVAGRCRPITPLCRPTGGVRAPVGIVPPIMHVVTALGDVRLLSDEHCIVSTRQQVRRQHTVKC